MPGASSTRAYYLEWGRTWERAALSKARPIAGDLALGAMLLRALEPFLYRRAFGADAIEELGAMKRRVEAKGHASRAAPLAPRAAPGAPKKRSWRPGRRAPPRAPAHRASAEAPGAPAAPGDVPGWDIKSGGGGIRAIEFFVQALLLVHAGRDPELRCRGTLTGLARLAGAGLLSEADRAALADAYALWRRLEHRAQMASDLQTHSLPEAPEAFAVFAERAGLSAAALEELVGRHRRAVRARFDRLFVDPSREAAAPDPGAARRARVDALLSLPASMLRGGWAVAELGAVGFDDPERAAASLAAMRRAGTGPLGAERSSARARFGRFLVSAAAESSDPGRALGFIHRLHAVAGGAEWFWALFADRPPAARVLVQQIGTSEYLTRRFLAHPEAAAAIFGAAGVARLRDRGALRAERDAALRGADPRDVQLRLGRLGAWLRGAQVRAALAALAGGLDARAASAALTELAELAVSEVARVVGRALLTSLGRPPDLSSIPICVIAMGKFGGAELGFRSDLDLIFLHEPGANDAELGPRFARRFLRALHDLYEVDARLRPSGGRGALVVTPRAFAAYHDGGGAGLWERQALTRARAVWGEASLRARFDEERARALARALGPDARAETAAMRARIGRPRGWPFSLKEGAGGLVDLEFAIQFIQLERLALLGAALEPSAALAAPGVWAALGALGSDASARAAYSSIDFASLTADYTELRRLEALCALTGAGSAVIERAALPTLARHSRRPGAEGARELEEQIEALRARVGATLESILGGLS